MAVSKAQEWVTPTSVDPSGTTTIGGGTNRCMIFSMQAEFSGDVTCSVAIGNVAATGLRKVFYDIGGSAEGDDLFIWNWYWDEAALESMAGNNISYSDSDVTNFGDKRFWSYATFASCDQTIPIVFSSAVSDVVSSANPLVIPTPGESGDFVITPSSYRSGTGTKVLDPNKTQIYDAITTDRGGFRAILMDGVWTSATSFTGQSGFGAHIACLSMVLKAADSGSGGSGNIIAPAASTSASGTVGINNAINPQPTVAGVGERVIVWQGKVELTAVNATSSSNFQQIIIFNDPAPSQLEMPWAEYTDFAGIVAGLGIRKITGTGVTSAPAINSGGAGPAHRTGTGSCDAPVALVSANDIFAATWFTRKTVVFQA